jgi:hypothetical protein
LDLSFILDFYLRTQYSSTYGRPITYLVGGSLVEVHSPSYFCLSHARTHFSVAAHPDAWALVVELGPPPPRCPSESYSSVRHIQAERAGQASYHLLLSFASLTSSAADPAARCAHLARWIVMRSVRIYRFGTTYNAHDRAVCRLTAIYTTMYQFHQQCARS